MTVDVYPDGPVQRLARREFGDKDVRKMLDSMDDPALVSRFGQPSVVVRYSPTRGHWRQGDPRPPLADEDPAVMQAIGRCAAADLHRRAGFLAAVMGTHDRGRCAWCDYPLEARLAACDWATFRSRFVESELRVWWQYPEAKTGAAYLRGGRQDVYENPTWAAFWALSREERERRIVAAQYPEDAA